MHSFAIAAVTFACAFGGAMLGMVLRSTLPETQLNAESREVIKLGTGLIGTMAALVIGLLVASASSAFNAEDGNFQQLAIDVILLDRTLARYGPESADARAEVRRLTAWMLDRLAPTEASRSPGFDSRELTTGGESLFTALTALQPQNEAQKTVVSQSLQLLGELGKIRWALSEGIRSSIPTTFLVVLLFWLAVLYTGFGLLSPRNLTVVVVYLLCALSVAGAIFLILDMDQPFEGLIHVSSDPLRNALAQLKG